jgi:hypothetical protein
VAVVGLITAAGRVAVLLALVSGCAAPTLTQEGQLVFSETEQRGATVLTANGVEFIDRSTVPAPRIRKSAFEPWQPPTGFLLPADGVLRETSRPVALEGNGLLVVMRASDRLLPTWGGELLMRLDVIVPPAAFASAKSTVREPIALVIVIDDDGLGSLPLVEAALDNLGQRDRVALVDSAIDGRTAVPLVPGTHRTLVEGTAERVLEQRARGPRQHRDLGKALELAGTWLNKGGAARTRRVLVLTDGVGIAADRGRVGNGTRKLARSKVKVTAVAATDRVDRDTLSVFGDDVHAAPEPSAREQAVLGAFAPPGDVVLQDLVLGFSSVPAPVHLVEASAGEPYLGLEADQLFLGDLYVGEARTEIVRLAIPSWSAGEDYRITVSADYRDARSGRKLRARKKASFVYSEQIATIADSRHGDVIAYASGLAMVKRLERAFAGSAFDRIGGLRAWVRWQANSLATYAVRSGDASLAQQAEVLSTLLAVVED